MNQSKKSIRLIPAGSTRAKNCFPFFFLFSFFLLSLVAGKKKNWSKTTSIRAPWERYEKPTGCISPSIYLASSCKDHLSCIWVRPKSKQQQGVEKEEHLSSFHSSVTEASSSNRSLERSNGLHRCGEKFVQPSRHDIILRDREIPRSRVWEGEEQLVRRDRELRNETAFCLLAFPFWNVRDFSVAHMSVII